MFLTWCHLSYQFLGPSSWLDRIRPKEWCCSVVGLIALASGLLHSPLPTGPCEWRGVSTLSQLLFGHEALQSGVETTPPCLLQYFSLYFLFLFSVPSCKPVAAVIPPGWARGVLFAPVSPSTDCYPSKTTLGSLFCPLRASFLPDYLFGLCSPTENLSLWLPTAIHTGGCPLHV